MLASTSLIFWMGCSCTLLHTVHAPEEAAFLFAEFWATDKHLGDYINGNINAVYKLLAFAYLFVDY